MEFLSDFLSWAWARHHNVLSWYIRPMFILPFIFFAYKRSWKGLVVTVIALFTSMFWFPAPATVDPAVEQFLQAERDYLLGEWTLAKFLVSLTVPAFFYFLGLAFWKRSWWWGVAVINLAALGQGGVERCLGRRIGLGGACPCRDRDAGLRCGGVSWSETCQWKAGTRRRFIMSVMQLIQLGALWGTIFGGVFSIAMLIIGRVNAEMILNDYPPDVRAKFGPMSEKARKQANLASLPLLATLGLIVVLGLGQLRNLTGVLTFLNTFIVTTTIFQVWNLIDLVLLDWFLLMTLKPRFMILPGTEGMAGYSDYGFHFRKFLNGIVFTLILSGVVTTIALGMEIII